MRLLILFLCGLVFSGGCQAHAPYKKPEVSVEVVADDGRVYPLHKLYPTDGRGNWRGWLEAEYGRNYTIRVRNLTGHRTGVVIAVDGRNIISGNRSELTSGESMYILGPYETGSYSGWRTASNRVNRFYFTDAGDSYAGAWNYYSAMGVIAVAAYREKRPAYRELRKEHSYKRRSGDVAGKSAPAPSGIMEDRAAELEAGTGYGDEQYSYARRVAFQAESSPMVKLFYKYEWRSTLCQKGIIECGRHNRFWPEHEEQYGFVPSPQSLNNR